MTPPTAPAPRSSFLVNLCSYYVGDACGLVGFVVLTPILLEYLGRAQYGLMAVAGAVLGYLGLLDLGLKPTLTRYVAAAEAVGDRARTAALISSTLVLFAGLGLVGLLLALVVSRFVGPLFDVDAALLPVCALFLALKGVQFAVALPLGTYESANYGTNDIARMNGIRSLGSLLELGGTLLVVWLDGGLPALAGMGIGITVVTGLLNRRVLRAALPGLRIRLALARAAIVRELFGYSFFFFLDSVIVLLVFKTGELVIGTLLGVSAVATYAILGQASRALMAAIFRISGTLYPSFSALAARGDQAELRRLFTRAMDGALLLATGTALLLGFFGTAVARRWLGVDDVEAGVLICFAGVILTHTPVSLASKYLAAAGLLPRLVVPSVLEGLGNLGLSIVLTGRFGVTGVAAATLVAQLLTTTWYNPRLACRSMGLPAGRFFLERGQRVALAGLPTLVLAAGLYWLVDPEKSLIRLILCLVASALVHTASAAFLWRRVHGRRTGRPGGELPPPAAPPGSHPGGHA